MNLTLVEWIEKEVRNLTNKLIDGEIGNIDFYEQRSNIFNIAMEMEKSQNQTGSVVCDGSIQVNLDNCTIKYKGETKHHPKKIVNLTAYLMRNKGNVVKRNDIIKNVWGEDIIVCDRTIDVHIRKIRQIFTPGYIMTMKKVGYKWVNE
mgnify:CR=1 FL=1